MYGVLSTLQHQEKSFLFYMDTYTDVNRIQCNSLDYLLFNDIPTRDFID